MGSVSSERVPVSPPDRTERDEYGKATFRTKLFARDFSRRRAHRQSAWPIAGAVRTALSDGKLAEASEL